MFEEVLRGYWGGFERILWEVLRGYWGDSDKILEEVLGGIWKVLREYCERF